jgi:hypothetical protein
MTAPAFAKDKCSVTAGPRDVVAKQGDLVIEAGRAVENVIALKGTITLKKGATAKSVVAVHGDVIVEAGAKVTDSVVTLAGTVKNAGLIRGSRVELHGQELAITGEDGDRIALSASLARSFLTELLTKVDSCLVEEAH